MKVKEESEKSGLKLNFQKLVINMPGLMKQKLESRWLGEISKKSDMQIPPLWQKAKKN